MQNASHHQTQNKTKVIWKVHGVSLVRVGGGLFHSFVGALKLKLSSSSPETFSMKMNLVCECSVSPS